MMHTKSVLAAVVLSGGVAFGQSKPAEAKFNPESAKMFAAQVQPILTNRCADCHARKDHGSGFVLRAIEPGINDPQGADANLRAAARWLTPADPHTSPFLTKATTAHGKAKDPPLAADHPAYKYLELWAFWACGPDGSAAPTVIPPPKEPTTVEPKATEPAKLTGFAAKADAPPTVTGTAATPPVADPFDPAGFNRQGPPKK
jgi:hypothetical protein